MPNKKDSIHELSFVFFRSLFFKERELTAQIKDSPFFIMVHISCVINDFIFSVPNL